MKDKGSCALAMAVIFASMAGTAYGANDRLYLSTIQPNDVAPGTTTNFNLTVTNNILSGPSHFLRQVIVTVPAAFTNIGTVTVQAPQAAPLPWIATVSGHTITVTSGSSSDASVTAGQSVTITVPATAPQLAKACPGGDSYTWAISASQVVGGGTGNAYLLTPGSSNPQVKIGCDILTSLNLTINPQAISTTNASAMEVLTATLTRAGGAAIQGEPITFTVGGQPVTCSAPSITNASGMATCSYFPQAAPNTPLVSGIYDAQASFAGDSALGYGSSVSNTAKLNVNTSDTGLEVSSVTAAFGATVSLTAKLTSNQLPIAGRSVSFAIGSMSAGSATTDNLGVATVNASLPQSLTPGTYGQEIKAAFAGDGTYAAVSSDATLVVLAFSSGLSWSNPAPILYGTPLSSTQLNATAAAPGTYVYTPPAGTVLNVGNGQTLSVMFTPNDLINYSVASATVSINVLPANQSTVTVTGPGSITFGTTGTATASGGSGTGAYAFSAGVSTGCTVFGTTVTVTNASGSCVLTATKAGDGNYTASAVSAPFTVTLVKASQAALTVTAPGSVTYGATGTAAASGGSGTGAVTFSAAGSTGCSVAGTTVSVSNASGTCSLTATKAADSNYSAATSAAFAVTLNKANQTIGAITAPAMATYGTTVSPVGATATSGLTVTFAGSGSCSAALLMTSGIGTCMITASQAGDNNYNAAAPVTTGVAAAKASAVITITGYTVSFDNSAHTATGTAVGFGGANLSAGLNLSGTTHTSKGDYTDPWTFSGGTNYNDATGTVHDVINGAAQTITFTSMVVTATATSGGTTMFTSGTLDACTVVQVLDPNNVPVNPGQATVTLKDGVTNWSLCHVVANQSGTSDYNSATPATGVLTIQ